MGCVAAGESNQAAPLLPFNGRQGARAQEKFIVAQLLHGFVVRQAGSIEKGGAALLQGARLYVRLHKHARPNRFLFQQTHQFYVATNRIVGEQRYQSPMVAAAEPIGKAVEVPRSEERRV